MEISNGDYFDAYLLQLGLCVLQYLLGELRVAGIAAIVLLAVAGNQLNVAQILRSTVIAMGCMESKASCY